MDASPPLNASEIDIIGTAMRWLDDGHAVNLVTVARTWGSSPRPVGSMAIVRDDGRLAGSVSGGCIETQLVNQIAGDAGFSHVSHTIADEDARRVGLTCGGKLELVFESLTSSAALAPIIDALTHRRRITRVVDLVEGQAQLIDGAETDNPTFSSDDRYLTRVFGPDWRVLLIGAGELSRYTAEFARALDFDVVVCEPREAFRDTFAVDKVLLIDALPDDAALEHAADSRSAVLALSHDPSLDDLALEQALASDCFHIAALGSRKSHAARCRRLAFLGVSEQQLARISAPAGLDIGSQSAAEIAVSIVAELIAVRASLRSTPRS